MLLVARQLFQCLSLVAVHDTWRQVAILQHRGALQILCHIGEVEAFDDVGYEHGRANHAQTVNDHVKL